MAKLLSSLPVGAKVKDIHTTYYDKPILFTVMEHNHAGDPDNSTALVTTGIITIKCFDAAEPNNSDSDCRQKGNNRYLYSNIKQWLNSDKPAGQWYVAQHSADAAPISSGIKENKNAYDQEAGFLANFSEQMKAKLFTVTKRVGTSTTVNGKSYENVTQKIFLLSGIEVDGRIRNGDAGGSIYELFKTERNRRACYTAEAIEKTENVLGKEYIGKPGYYWVSTPMTNNSYDNFLAYTEDACSYTRVYESRGVRPACVVSSSLLVSDTADTDGVYTILWNTPPVIETDSGNLGDKNAPFNLNYTITDADNDKVTAKVMLDEEVVQTLDTVVLGSGYKVSISGTKINSLSAGSHKFTIWAKDSYGNESTKTVTFNKIKSSIVISGADSNIGNKWQPFDTVYQVSDAASKSVTVTEYIDDKTIRTIEKAAQGENITFDLSGFDTLENEKSHKLTIKAVNSDGEESYRYIEFVKLYKELKFEIKAAETDAPAKKIMVNIDYDKTGNPDIMVEVTNCAYNTQVVWEDATKAFKNKEAYHFTNEVFDNKKYGVSVRITVAKNSSTERVYVLAVGYSFD